MVVPVYNGGRTIRATIECLLKQTLAPLEIIVVDDGSTDDTVDILREFDDRIKLISKSNGGPASARNVGVRASNGSLIAFTDSDCLPHQDWLQEIVKGFYAPDIAGAGGSVRGAYPGLVGEYIDLNRSLDPGFAPGGIVMRLVTANACFRRDALVEANLFDVRFRRAGGEDTELSVRLRKMGYELVYVSSAVVLHQHRRTIREYLATAANYGEGHYVLETLWPECSWTVNHRRQMFRYAIAARSMLKLSLTYKQHYDLRRAALFSFLEHYKHVAYLWGYLRGKRNNAQSCNHKKVVEHKETVPAKHQISSPVENRMK